MHKKNCECGQVFNPNVWKLVPIIDEKLDMNLWICPCGKSMSVTDSRIHAPRGLGRPRVATRIHRFAATRRHISWG